jgi:hypothetical protein
VQISLLSISDKQNRSIPTQKGSHMANSNEKPDVKVNVYGSNAPAAAKFGVGATTRQEIEEPTQARRDQRPGDYNDSNKR